MSSIPLVILTLGALVFFHELGHLVTAKLLGIGVRVFSLGFGPKVLSREFRGTEYQLSAIPFGGYVSFKAQGSPEEVKGRLFEGSPVRVRTLVVLAGPIANMLLAFVLCWGLFWHNGLSVLPPVVGKVQVQSPAERVGILAGDTILKVSGVATPFWEDVADRVAATKGNPFKITLMREGNELTLDIEPEWRTRQTVFGDVEPVGFIGIVAKGPRETHPLNGLEAAREGLFHTWKMISETAKAFAMLVAGHLPSDAVGGPIMISQAISEHAKSGFSTLAALIAIISVNLGLVNLLPLPALDGGHILMFGIEAIRGRPLSERMQKVFHRTGLALLIFLMAWGTFNDIMRL
jgi:regulator of sigma E protease